MTPEILSSLLKDQTLVVVTVYRSGRVEVEPGVKVVKINDSLSIDTEYHGIYCRNNDADYLEINVDARSITARFDSDEGCNIVSRTFTVLNVVPNREKNNHRYYHYHDEAIRSTWLQAEIESTQAQIAQRRSRRASTVGRFGIGSRATTKVPTDAEITRAAETR